MLHRYLGNYIRIWLCLVIMASVFYRDMKYILSLVLLGGIWGFIDSCGCSCSGVCMCVSPSSLFATKKHIRSGVGSPVDAKKMLLFLFLGHILLKTMGILLRVYFITSIVTAFGFFHSTLRPVPAKLYEMKRTVASDGFMDVPLPGVGVEEEEETLVFSRDTVMPVGSPGCIKKVSQIDASKTLKRRNNTNVAISLAKAD